MKRMSGIKELRFKCLMCFHSVDMDELKELKNCPICHLRFCKRCTDEDGLCKKCTDVSEEGCH